MPHHSHIAINIREEVDTTGRTYREGHKIGGKDVGGQPIIWQHKTLSCEPGRETTYGDIASDPTRATCPKCANKFWAKRLEELKAQHGIGLGIWNVEDDKRPAEFKIKGEENTLRGLYSKALYKVVHQGKHIAWLETNSGWGKGFDLMGHRMHRGVLRKKDGYGDERTTQEALDFIEAHDDGRIIATPGYRVGPHTPGNEPKPFRFRDEALCWLVEQLADPNNKLASDNVLPVWDWVDRRRAHLSHMIVREAERAEEDRQEAAEKAKHVETLLELYRAVNDPDQRDALKWALTQLEVQVTDEEEEDTANDD